MGMHCWPEAQQDDVRRVLNTLKSGGLVLLLGPYGTGKTQLGAWCCQGCCASWGKPAMYRRFADLLSEARTEAYGEHGSDAAVVRRLSLLGLLVIDELHYRRWSQDEQLWLVRILDHRYGEKAPTLIIANLTPDSLPQVLDPSTLDRLREGGAVVVLGGESRRGAGAP